MNVFGGPSLCCHTGLGMGGFDALDALDALAALAGGLDALAGGFDALAALAGGLDALACGFAALARGFDAFAGGFDAGGFVDDADEDAVGVFNFSSHALIISAARSRPVFQASSFRRCFITSAALLSKSSACLFR